MTQATQPVVVITGASQGLGLALARKLLRHSFSVAVCARSAERLTQAFADFPEAGSLYLEAGDVRDSAFCTRFIEGTAARFGRIDALVNNASTLGDVPMPALLQTAARNLMQTFETNAVAPLLWSQAAYPWLKQARQGLLIGISSDAAVGGYAGWGVYGSTKATLDLMLATLANEVDPTVSVLAIDPGDMDTAMHRTAAPEDTGLPKPETVAEALLPLFTALQTGAPPLYPSGSRLSVRNGRLIGGDAS